MAKFILWAPRVLALLIMLFIIVMAFNTTELIDDPKEKSAGLLYNLIPALVILAGIITGWNHKMAGGIILIIAGGVMSFMLRKYGNLIPFLPLSTPVLVTGILYVLCHFYEKAQPQR